MKARKEEIAEFSIYGERQADGSIELGHTGETRTVEEWPDTMAPGTDHFDFGLEYVEKQMDDGVEKFYDVDEVPSEPGLEWGVYL